MVPGPPSRYSDSGGVERHSRCRRASSATWRRTASSWSTRTSSGAVSARCRRTTSRLASMRRTGSAEKYVLRSGYGLYYGAFENRGGNPSLGYNYPFQFTLRLPVAQRRSHRTDWATDRSSALDARDRIVLDPANVNANGLDTARCRVRLQDAAVSQLQRDAPDRACCRITPSRSDTSGPGGATSRPSPA